MKRRSLEPQEECSPYLRSAVLPLQKPGISMTDACPLVLSEILVKNRRPQRRRSALHLLRDEFVCGFSSVRGISCLDVNIIDVSMLRTAGEAKVRLPLHYPLLQKGWGRYPMDLYANRPRAGKVVGSTGYILFVISWIGYLFGRSLWPSLFAPWPCVAAGYGCALAFIAGVLACILNWSRWRWWLCLSLLAFVSTVYLGLAVSDI
jgi:hypothetical protein